MKRITTVLKASEATAVRKAVFVAGGSYMVITPISHRECVTQLGDWYCGTQVSGRDDHVRLDVTADDDYSEDIISAIIKTAHAGKIESIVHLPAKAGRVSPSLLKRAA